MDDIKKYYTVRQVAKKLGLTEEWIRDLIAQKELKAIKIRQWKIRPEDLEKFIKTRWNIKN
jgi:excisionase family DNA binding protein